MILVVDCGSSKTKYIEQVIDEFDDFTTVPFFDFNPSELSKFDGVVISGAPLLITEINMLPYIEKSEWIRSSSIPVLGICFGHQLIGILFGGFGSKMKEDRNWQTIESFEDCPLLDKLPNEFEMMEDHCETISIPQGFRLIASSDSCVNEVMQHLEKSIFGVQFHPEVSGNMGRIIFDNFVRICHSSN